MAAINIEDGSEYVVANVRGEFILLARDGELPRWDNERRWQPNLRHAMTRAAVEAQEAYSRIEQFARPPIFSARQAMAMAGLDGLPDIGESNGLGLEAAIEHVREFHLAIAESNPDAAVRERVDEPALVRRVERHRMLREEVNELVDATMENDRVEVLDAIVDCIYILIGTGLIQFGGDRLARAWAAVHASNMTKRWPDGTFHTREDGKVEKPPGWVAPDIASIVDDA